MYEEGMSAAKDMPHILTFDNVGVAIRRKNSKAVNFVEWRVVLRNVGALAFTQESAEDMRELRREEYGQDGGPKKKKKRKKSNVAGIDRTQVGLEGEPGPGSPPEDLEEERKTLFEELNED